MGTIANEGGVVFVKQLDRKRLMVVGGLVVAAVLLVVATQWLTVWSQPTKKDYQDAKSAVSSLSEKYDDLSLKLSAYTSSLTTSLKAKATTKNKAAYEKAVSSLNASFEKIEGMKALQNDDVDAAFDKLVDQKKKTLAYSDGFALYRISLLECSDVFDVTDDNESAKDIAAAHEVATKDCLPTLDKLARSDVKIFANYAKGFASIIRDRQTTFDDYASKKLSGKQAGDKIAELGEELKTVFNTTNGLQKARDEASTKSQLKEMNEVLDQQIKQS